MSKYLKLVINSIFFIIFSAACLQAQFIIQQVEYEIPVSYSLIPEDVEIESEKEEALFFMTIPVEKLKQAAVEEGQEVELDFREAARGDQLTFDRVLAVRDDEGFRVGQPTLEDQGRE